MSKKQSALGVAAPNPEDAQRSAASFSPIQVVEKRKIKGQSIVGAPMWEKALKQRKRAPIVLALAPPARAEIGPSRYHLLEVDKRYQREIQPTLVNDLITVLKKGGTIPDPITLVQRNWTDPFTKPGKYYIVDGQQRALAHMEVGVPILAFVYKTDSLEQERQLFLLMQEKVSVHPNVIVRSWNGPVAEALRASNDNPDHPMHKRISFGPNGAAPNARIFYACSLVRACVNALGGTYTNGRMQEILSSADGLHRQHGAAARLRAYLELMAAVFPSTGGAIGKWWIVKVLAMQAIGQVAYKRWNGKDPIVPGPKVLARLQTLPWERLILGNAAIYRPMVEAAIEEVWR